MKKYTQEDFDNFEVDRGGLQDMPCWGLYRNKKLWRAVLLWRGVPLWRAVQQGH